MRSLSAGGVSGLPEAGRTNNDISHPNVFFSLGCHPFGAVFRVYETGDLDSQAVLQVITNTYVLHKNLVRFDTDAVVLAGSERIGAYIFTHIIGIQGGIYIF